MVSTHGSDGFRGNCFTVFNVSSISLLLYSLVIFFSFLNSIPFLLDFLFGYFSFLVIFEACLCAS